MKRPTAAIVLSATLLLATANFSEALVPKQVVKHGLMTFISEIAEPTESNVCFLFFEKMVLAVLDEKKSFEEAVNLALTQDFTHAQVKGRCQKTYKVVMEKFSNQADMRSKLIAAWTGINQYVKEVLKEEKDFKDDECLVFIKDLSGKIVKEKIPDLINSSYPELSKALLKSALQYLQSGHDNLPCVKAMKLMFGKYSKEIRDWIYWIITSDEKEQVIGGLDWGLTSKDEL